MPLTLDVLWERMDDRFGKLEVSIKELRREVDDGFLRKEVAEAKLEALSTRITTLEGANFKHWIVAGSVGGVVSVAISVLAYLRFLPHP